MVLVNKCVRKLLKNSHKILNFSLGFVISTVFVYLVASNYYSSHEDFGFYKKAKSPEGLRLLEDHLYEQELADKLFNEIRIVCWVFTHPDNHKTKVPEVRKTWGRKCNKLLFMSHEADPDQPDIIALPIEGGRKHLWNKTRLAMHYVYKNHLNDGEWFMRTDDDNYVIMENLRHKLYQFRWKTSLYIGHRYCIHMDIVPDGYMAGGGHILSKRAFIKMETVLSPNDHLCPNHEDEMDDVFMGVCLSSYALFIDAIDDLNQKQMFIVGTEEHTQYKNPDFSYWYWRNLWTNVTQGGLGCCSDLLISDHYISPKRMNFLEYLVYHVHPFGLSKNLTEQLPRKLTLKEMIKLSEAKTYSPNFVNHTASHKIESDEKFK